MQKSGCWVCRLSGLLRFASATFSTNIDNVNGSHDFLQVIFQFLHVIQSDAENKKVNVTRTFIIHIAKIMETLRRSRVVESRHGEIRAVWQCFFNNSRENIAAIIEDIVDFYNSKNFNCLQSKNWIVLVLCLFLKVLLVSTSCFDEVILAKKNYFGISIYGKIRSDFFIILKLNRFDFLLFTFFVLKFCFKIIIN